MTHERPRGEREGGTGATGTRTAGTAHERPRKLVLAYERPNGSTGIVSGRVAWTLRHLVNAGRKGVTPIERPAPRWSDYVFRLRALGFPIVTHPERHGGQFAGNHGRYELRERVEIRDLSDDPPRPRKRKATPAKGGLSHIDNRRAGDGKTLPDRAPVRKDGGAS